MARICFTLEDGLDEIITNECDQSGQSKSAWCASALESYLRLRDRKSDQDCDQVRIAAAVCEERVRGQAVIIEEMRARAVQAEGLVQSLMVERQSLLPARTGFWSRLFGKG